MEQSRQAASAQPIAAVLSVGTELTEGSTRDVHGSFIAAAFRSIGIHTRSILLIPDDAGQFREELERAVRLSELVVVTGGLGPTTDDLTRETVAAVGSRELEFHEELWRDIEQRFSGRPVSATNRKQALLPSGFTAIPNPHGTAPAFWGRIAGDERRSPGCLVVALPGPPRELRPLFRDAVLPLLSRELDLKPSEELRMTVFLLSESTLEQMLGEVRSGTVSWGTRAEAYRIVVVLRGGERRDREAMFAALRGRVGGLRVRREEVGAEELVVEALRRAGSSLATAESCTGGLVAKLVTDVGGVSEFFWGGLVTYSNEAKVDLLGVPREVIEAHGAVSEETVAAMIRGCLAVSHAGFSCAVSGVAGPSGGSPEKPVGTVWIASGSRDGRLYAREFHFSGDRDMVRRKSAVATLLMCEATITGEVVDKSDAWQYI